MSRVDFFSPTSSLITIKLFSPTKTYPFLKFPGCEPSTSRLYLWLVTFSERIIKSKGWECGRVLLVCPETMSTRQGFVVSEKACLTRWINGASHSTAAGPLTERHHVLCCFHSWLLGVCVPIIQSPLICHYLSLWCFPMVDTHANIHACTEESINLLSKLNWSNIIFTKHALRISCSSWADRILIRHTTKGMPQHKQP